ncbi:hypothetical protein Tco_0400151 [Tanacetum coccineum]
MKGSDSPSPSITSLILPLLYNLPSPPASNASYSDSLFEASYSDSLFEASYSDSLFETSNSNLRAYVKSCLDGLLSTNPTPEPALLDAQSVCRVQVYLS